MQLAVFKHLTPATPEPVQQRTIPGHFWRLIPY